MKYIIHIIVKKGGGGEREEREREFNPLVILLWEPIVGFVEQKYGHGFGSGVGDAVG